MAREESEIRPPGHRPLQAGGRGGKATRTKKSSRIPGIYVGEEINTSLGKKKKICLATQNCGMFHFNIGGPPISVSYDILC